MWVASWPSRSQGREAGVKVVSVGSAAPSSQVCLLMEEEEVPAETVAVAAPTRKLWVLKVHGRWRDVRSKHCSKHRRWRRQLHRVRGWPEATEGRCFCPAGGVVARHGPDEWAVEPQVRWRGRAWKGRIGPATHGTQNWSLPTCRELNHHYYQCELICRL